MRLTLLNHRQFPRRRVIVGVGLAQVVYVFAHGPQLALQELYPPPLIIIDLRDILYVIVCILELLLQFVDAPLRNNQVKKNSTFYSSISIRRGSIFLVGTFDISDARAA